MASSGAYGSCGLPAAPGAPLAAGAAHRAAMRDIGSDNISVGGGDSEGECHQERECYSDLVVPPIQHISVIAIWRNETLCNYTAIGDFETSFDTRLRRNFAAVVCKAQCKPFVVEHSLRAGAFVQCEENETVIRTLCVCKTVADSTAGV